MYSFLTRLGPFVKGVIGAVIGTAVVLLAVHLYFDHLALHRMADFVNQVAPKLQKLP